MPTANDRARVAFEQRDWAEVHRLLSEPIPGAAGPRDLERLAVAAYLVGDDQTSADAWERAHREHLRADQCAEAALCAFWLALSLLLRGEMARAGGWLARAGRIVEESRLDCRACGYLLVPQFLQALEAGDLVACEELATEIRRLGRRFDDADLLAFGTLCEGQTALAAGRTADGLALLDETMVGLRVDAVSPIPTGIIYCAVIETCMLVHDLRRAAEWTEALSAWCDSQPGLVPFRGQCLVHRSQILLHRGDWPAALAEARHAEVLLSDPLHPALGLAHYQQGEVHRVRGEDEAAERCYQVASRLGHRPQPGLALLRLAQGDRDAAHAMLRAVDEASDPFSSPLELAASIELMRMEGDTDGARRAADTLAALASDDTTTIVGALAGHATGVVLLAEGEPAAALVELRAAAASWAELDAPYEAARTRTSIGLAYAALGDRTSADMELSAAREVFADLGAAPDVARIDSLLGRRLAPPHDALTAREQEVLRAVAAGKTNREVADALTISEHTVARHLQNIYTKIGVRSRAAATAYAYEHHLV